MIYTSITPYIQKKVLATANTEYSLAVPNNSTQYDVGQWATTATVYMYYESTGGATPDMYETITFLGDGEWGAYFLQTDTHTLYFWATAPATITLYGWQGG